MRFPGKKSDTTIAKATLIITLIIASFQVFYMKQQNEISQRQSDIYQQQLVGSNLTSTILQSRDNIHVSIKNQEIDRNISETIYGKKSKADKPISTKFIVIENKSLIPITFPVIEVAPRSSHLGTYPNLITTASVIDSCETLTIPLIYLAKLSNRSIEHFPQKGNVLPLEKEDIENARSASIRWGAPDGYISTVDSFGGKFLIKNLSALDTSEEIPLGNLTHKELYEVLRNSSVNKNSESNTANVPEFPLAFTEQIKPPENFIDTSPKNQFDPRTPTIIDNKCKVA